MRGTMEALQGLDKAENIENPRSGAQDGEDLLMFRLRHWMHQAQ